jgi:type III secretory pathway component EscR
MELTEIISIIMSGITMISILFAVFHYFKNPQINLEKKQAINEVLDKGKTPLTNFEVLKSQFDMMCKSNSDTFAKLEKQVIDAFAIANNHINTTDKKVDGLVQSSNLQSNEITRLATIIEERIPKKG